MRPYLDEIDFEDEDLVQDSQLRGIQRPAEGDVRTTTLQTCEAVPRRARIQGS